MGGPAWLVPKVGARGSLYQIAHGSCCEFMGFTLHQLGGRTDQEPLDRANLEGHQQQENHRNITRGSGLSSSGYFWPDEDAAASIQ